MEKARCWFGGAFFCFGNSSNDPHGGPQGATRQLPCRSNGGPPIAGCSHREGGERMVAGGAGGVGEARFSEWQNAGRWW